MVWARVAASGPLYQYARKENVRTVCELNQKNNDPKHTSRPTKELLKNKSKVLEWPSQSNIPEVKLYRGMG